MADANVQEQGTYPAKHMIDDYFGKLATDLRFTQCDYKQFNAHTAMDKNSAELEFILGATDAPQCYQLSDALIELTLNITKADGVTMPDPSSKVGPVNNVLGSVFSNVTLKINDNAVTEASDFYGYKCYMKRLLTFNEDVKIAQYQTSGYVTDTCTSGSIEPSLSNQGWQARGNLFREGYAAGAAFRPEGATFIGPFMHDLSYINKLLPPSKIFFLLNNFIKFNLQYLL